MRISEIKERLKIGDIPKVAEDIFASDGFDEKDTAFLDEDYMRSISRKYKVLGKDEDECIAKALKIKENEAALAFFNLAVKFLDWADGDVEKSLMLTVPDSEEGEDELDMLPMAVLFTQMDKSRERYLAMGMSEEDAMMHMEAYGKSFIKSSNLMQRSGLNRMYFNWLCIYLGAGLVTVSGFNFEMKKNPATAVFIRNKATGKLLALSFNQKIHKSGNVFMSAGCTDEEGSFIAEYKESDEEFKGYPINEKGLCEKDEKCYKKSRWEKVLSPGDDVISFHIPKNADLTPANLDKVFSEGIKKVKEYYRDKSVRCIICGSWLLSPQLWDIMNEKSNIVAFGKRFTLAPMRSAGKDVFSFVFPPGIKNYEELPENTTLERGLKKLYLEGKYLYTFYGAFEI